MPNIMASQFDPKSASSAQTETDNASKAATEINGKLISQGKSLDILQED